jgi:isoleucyl-tRNA synthetase
MRKEAGFAVTDRIRLTLFGSERLRAAWDSFAGLAASETLAKETEWAQAAGQLPLEAGDETWLVKIEKL